MSNYVNPTLPSWLPDIELQQLRVGPCSINLHFWREEDARSQWEVCEISAHEDVAKEDMIQVVNELASTR
jgi:hypothetical protein